MESFSVDYNCLCISNNHSIVVIYHVYEIVQASMCI